MEVKIFPCIHCLYSHGTIDRDDEYLNQEYTESSLDDEDDFDDELMMVSEALQAR